MNINILGTWYRIDKIDYTSEPYFKESTAVGFCEYYAKRIVICDLKTNPDFSNDEESIRLCTEKRNTTT